MSDSYVECLVKAKQPIWAKILKVLLVTLTVLSCLVMFVFIIFLPFLTECAIIVNNAVSVVIGFGSMAI